MHQVQITLQRRGKKRYACWLSGVVIMIVIACYLFSSQAEIVVLRSEEPLALGASPVLPAIGTNLVTTLDVGDNAYVIKCMDIKTDVVILLRTKTGETGYVGPGKYVLIRNKVNLYTFISEYKRVTFSCGGMFEHRSQWVNGNNK